MRIIFNPVIPAQRIFGLQKFRQEEPYRLTRFCVKVACDDGTLYYHTLNGMLVLFENGETSEDHLVELVKYRFFVPVSLDERKHALEYRRILSMLIQKTQNRTAFTILTTTDCNARCFYCYERGTRRITMTPQTARDTAEYIANACGGERIKLIWFGGEPLYNPEAIDIITAYLQKRGIDYYSKIITNGYLFDRSLAERAKSVWRLTSAHITLDGTKDRYQKTKAYIYNDENAYERVLENIGCLLDNGIKVSVRLNMNRMNADDLSLLSEELYIRFKHSALFSVAPVLLKDFAGDVCAFESAEVAVERFLQLSEKLKEFGLLHQEPLKREISALRCMADNDKCELIMPDGRIGKCEHIRDEDMIGSIYHPDRDVALIAAWKEQVTDAAECQTCTLYPRCIELKKCAWAKDGCSSTVRRLRLLKLKDQILTAYNESKEV